MMPTFVIHATTSVTHQFARLVMLNQWWHWLVLVLVVAAIVTFVGWLYRRDSIELPRGRAFALFALRLAALAGILFFFFDLERRSERQVVRPSRALLLVDTSLSMGIQDADNAAGKRRADQVADEFERGELVEKLRQQHEVVVYRFDETEAPVEVASYPQANRSSGESGESAGTGDQLADELRQTRIITAIAGGCGLLATLLLIIYALTGTAGPEGKRAWAAMLGILGWFAAIVILAVASLRYPDVGLLTTLGLREPIVSATSGSVNRGGDESTVTGQAAAAEGSSATEVKVAWREALAPRGAETRLGDALRYVVNRERDGSIAGVIVVSDGRSNAGVEAEPSAVAASAAGIPVYAIGLGSDRRPANVRVVDLEIPTRVYPGDKFSVAGYIQAFGLESRTVKVELVSSSAAQPETSSEKIEEERSLKLGADGEVTPIRFEITPQEIGTRTYQLRVVPPIEDQDARDNQRSAKVQMVERRNHVLLWAGGPSREFQFLRNLLFRDRSTTSDVYLQTAEPGASQESNRLLFEFPKTREELFEYDCIIAFDPDWLVLDELQVQNLERWVAEKAGGLIVVAGPVHTPRWASRLRGDQRIDIVKNLYPVIFYSRGSATLSLGRFAGETAWPLQFTRDGLDAEYLWLEDDPLLNEQAWKDFAGVFGYYAVKDPKPGARVLAYFADPNTAMDGTLPIYLAAHFYGAGRVFFQASGEMWRIRAVDDAYFERYYTKLIRWASEGRLLRDSQRGVLIVDKDRCSLGDVVTVQAILTDAQFEPLVADQVTAALIDPTGQSVPLVLRRVQDAAREGMYTGQFNTRLEGDYRIELQPPLARDEDLLVKEVRSRIPALETERPERDDALLRLIADRTEGAYFVGFDAALNRTGSGTAPLPSLLEPREQVTVLAGTPDRDFDRQLMTWLLGMITGVLCLEWTIRRLSKLA